MKHTRQNPITKSITATRVPITTPKRNGVWKIYSTQSLRSHESKVRLESNNSSPVTCPGKFKITMLDICLGNLLFNFLLKPSISEVEGSGTLSTKIFWSLVAIPKMKVFFSFWNTGLLICRFWLRTTNIEITNLLPTCRSWWKICHDFSCFHRLWLTKKLLIKLH